MPDSVVEFELRQRDLVELQKAAAVLGLADLCVQTEGETLMMTAVDKKANNSSNSYSIDLENYRPMLLTSSSSSRLRTLR